MTLTSTVDGLRDSLDAELSDILSSRAMPLYKMMSYHMGWHDAHGVSTAAPSGARNHGVLCLLACRALGGDAGVALPAAAALELVNNFCEIHDDVQGGTPRRDNRDTVWWIWGPAQAINAGDGMHALARLALFRLLQKGVSSAVTLRAVQLLDEACLRTCEGRFMDMEAQEQINLSVNAYLEMAAGKAGALLACAMKLGALVASADDETVAAMGTSGSRLGLAMQVQADLREMWGRPSEGEPAAPSAQVMNKRKLLPVVYALERAPVREKRRLGEIYFKRVLEAEGLVRLREVVEELGARAHCETLVQQYRSEAIAALDAPGIPAAGRAEIERFMASTLR